LRHLFLDPALLARSQNVALRVNPPERREAVIQRDRPWEAVISLYLTVLEDEGRLRMWYILRDESNELRVAYAESHDGVNWSKPDLGITEYRGSKANNLVDLPDGHGCVFRDPRAATAAERYVFVTYLRETGIFRFASPDGLRWRRDPQALLPFRADTQNVTFWDQQRQAYVLYLRSWDISPGFALRLRTVSWLELPTLAAPAPVTPGGRGNDPARPSSLPRIVDELPVVMAADAQDPPESDIYTSSVQPYPLDSRWYVGFPSLFCRWPGSLDEGALHALAVGSRDGIRWHRYDRAPYMARGEPGTESAGMVFMGTGMVIRGDEIWQYGASFRTTHGTKQMKVRLADGDGTIFRYVQRVDGFVAADFCADGELWTEPVEVDGSRLLLNVNAPGRPLLVAVCEPGGAAIPGFGYDECAGEAANSTAAAVKWQGREDVRALEGRTVQLRFKGSHARLYSFRFEG
jgi:hypothetical protein